MLDLTALSNAVKGTTDTTNANAIVVDQVIAFVQTLKDANGNVVDPATIQQFVNELTGAASVQQENNSKLSAAIAAATQNPPV